jgi:hypothetical protein
MKRKLQLSLPTLFSVAATRGLLGLGAGLLLSDKSVADAASPARTNPRCRCSAST